MRYTIKVGQMHLPPAAASSMHQPSNWNCELELVLELKLELELVNFFVAIS